jgi:uncharacterized protein
MTVGAIALALAVRTLGGGATQTPPPSMGEVSVVVRGARMNGFVYVAAGEGPHPVALFLHGFPGNEKNLDLAQAVRRAGWDAVYVDYRGSWGSGGTFSFAGSLEDAAAWLGWIRDPANAAKYRYDPKRVAIVGHSFGGWLALLAARREPPDVCVAAIAAWNVGWLSQHRDDPALRETVNDVRSDFRSATDPAGGPLKTTPDALWTELASAPADWDYLKAADALKGRPLLLVAASRDTPDEDAAMHERLARAVRDAGGGRVRSVTLDDDHPFSASRTRLADILVQWLEGDCGGGVGNAAR